MAEKVAIITDTNSGITNELADKLNIFILPMPFIINGVSYFEGLNFTKEQFYEEMRKDSDISTSQPSPGSVIELWENVLKDYDTIVHIPMSSGLSSSCDVAKMLSDDFEGKVQVVDNKRISITQKQSVFDAIKLRDMGLSAVEIKNKLEETAYDASIYIAVDTLKYLKKGGRVTPAGAAIGSVLNLKPVLQIQGSKLDAFSKTRGMKMAEKKLIEAIKKDLTERFKDYDNMCVAVAYSGDESIGEYWKAKVQENFPDFDIDCDPLSLSVVCHTGEGALGIGCYVKL